MGQNTFLCFVLDNPNMIVEHWGMKKIIKFTCPFEIALDSDLAPFFGDLSSSEKFSYIEPPLSSLPNRLDWPCWLISHRILRQDIKKSQKSEKWRFKQFKSNFIYP